MSAPTRGVFVTGTDTGVGKTVVTCALIAGLRARGVDAAGMKPIETGVGADGPLDALALRAAAGDADPLDEVCPQQFALPAAPTVAAKAEGRRVDLAAIDAAHARLLARHDWLAVEGAGGMLVPAAEGLTMVDLADRLGLPLLLVARARLGTINHTRLSLEVARTRGKRVIGVVISHADGVVSPADAANLEALRDDAGFRVMGEIPPLDRIGPSISDHLDIDGIFAASSAS